jgi:hypothetical protein
MAALPPRPDLITITTPGGARFTVARQYQDRFQGLANELETGGYTIDPSQSGGYNPRFIAGTETPSQHAFGQAIDVNWRANPRGQGEATIPPDVARALAQKYNLTWGGDWQGNTRDPMHFEIAQGPKPALGVASANLPTPPVPPPGGPMGDQTQAPPPAPAPVPAPTQTASGDTSGPGPMLLAQTMPMLPGQPRSLADAFVQAAQRAKQGQLDQSGLG